MCEIALIPFSDNGQLTATTYYHGDFETRAAVGVGMRKGAACVEYLSTILEILLTNQRRYGLFPYICKCRVGHGGNHIPYHGIIGPNVYLQNEAFDDNINITADRTYVGSNVASDRTNGPVVIEKGDAAISSRYGVTISDSFEVKPGATLEITTNQPINQ